jgi:predicted DNA repair protein MutK
VGGGILVHGLSPVHHAVEALVAQLDGAGGLVQSLVPLLADALVGVVAGALVLAGVLLVQRLRAIFK